MWGTHSGPAWTPRVECDFTKFDSFGANFLDSVSANDSFAFISRLSILRPKSLWKLKGNMFPVRMLLIRKDSIKKKYQNGTRTSQPQIFFCPKFSFFFDLKIFHFSYNFEWKFRKWKNLRSKIFDFFRSKKIENFHSKVYEKWKFLRSKKTKIWDRKKSEVEK